MESSPNFISKLKELIAEGDLETAIQELLKNGYQQDKVTQLSGRYNDLLNRINVGIINSEEATLERNKIQAALLDILSANQEKAKSSLSNLKLIKPWQVVLSIATILGIFAAIAEISGYSIKDLLGFNTSPNYLTIYVHGPESKQQYLLENEGELIVDFGTRRDTRRIGESGRTNFGEVPERLLGERISLFLEAEGYDLLNRDSTYPLNGEAIYVAVKKDNSLCCVSGSVRDREGFLEGVRLSIGDASDISDKNGRFNIEIPIKDQKEEQELTAFKEGYEIWEESVYPATKQEVKILIKPTK